VVEGWDGFWLRFTEQNWTGRPRVKGAVGLACKNSKPRHATAGPPSMFNLLSFSVSGNYADISAAQIRTSSSTASFLSITSHVLRISNFDVQSAIPYHII